MKYFEREYYDDTIGGYLGFTEPIESWLKDKDVVLRGRKRVTRRHRRSIAKRDLHRFFPRYVLRSSINDLCKPAVKLNMVFIRLRIKDDGLLGLALVDSPRYKGRFLEDGRRLVWN